MSRETILSLPKSKTSTGIYAVRDENVEHHAPSKTKANKQVADQQFVAMTELSMYQQLNEKLQVKLQDVEAQKEEAIAAETRALNAAGALRRELDESQKAAERVERELREQLEAERARVDRQEGYMQEQQRKIVQLTQALETERSEVQRAAAHAQRAGQAADAAHGMLVAEREESQQREATAVENALFEARAARDAAEAARDDLAQRVEEMEEDVEAEREWRESAQKQAARLAKQADAAAAAADREEATAQNLRRALETLRQENEAAEATRKEEAERRRTGAARRVRDRQTSEHREKEALRAKVQSLEHDLEKANQRLDDMPRMQSEIRRLKVRRGKHRFELIFLDGTQKLTGILCFFVFCFSFNPPGIKSEARSTAAAKATACRGKIIADLSDTRAGTDYAKHDRDR